MDRVPEEVAAALIGPVVPPPSFPITRTAFSPALTFLELNGYPVMGGEAELEAATLEVASGKLDKSGAAAILEKIYNDHTAAD